MRSAAVVAVLVLLSAGAACSSSPTPTPTPPQGACGDGYLPAVNGSCPKGTCAGSGGAPSSCCGSECATCEDKGLVSTDDAGACPAGTCVSGDLTIALSCCDVCPGGGDAAAESGGDAASDVGADAGSSDAPGE
jgi:hypothetical protein